MTDVQSKQHETATATTILDLPTELIEYICCNDMLSMIDVFNLAISHSKLNECLFHESNSTLWKCKYIQRYGPLDEDEYKVLIDEQNTWKDEIMMRIGLERSVPVEIKQMPCKYKKSMNVPYHMYPFSEYLHSKNQGHRYYVISACTKYYKWLLLWSDNFNNHNDILFMTHQFLIYSCQVYFSYKIDEFLKLPPTQQIVERGFYLVGRWWCPTDDTPYRDISKKLDYIAMTVCNIIQSINPMHPLFEHGNCSTQVIERGKINLDHDLFDEANTIFILDNLRKVMFSQNQEVCYCTHDINCLLLQQVINRNKGSVFLLCVIFESIARRLGVKVKLTATCAHHFVSWTSSWPGTKKKVKEPTCYLIDISVGGVMKKATICPVSKKLPEHYNGNSLSDILWWFSKTVQHLSVYNLTTSKYVLDFQRLLKPEDSDVETNSKCFHEMYGYCRCPLIRNHLFPFAPHHVDEKNNLYSDFEDIFPLVPRKRSTFDNPTYAIGMVIDCIPKGSYSTVVNTCGIIVGWSNCFNTGLSNSWVVYYLLVKPDSPANNQENQLIKVVRGNRHVIQRNLKPFHQTFLAIGKFFKHFVYELGIYEPIEDLRKLYPDDLQYTKDVKCDA